MKYNYLPLTLLIILFSISCGFANATPNYPEYRIIKHNVKFWENIYGTLLNTEAIIHDRENIDFIYGKIHLIDTSLPGSNLLNKQIRSEILKNYRKTLVKLGTTGRAATNNEIRIYKYFSKDPVKLLEAAKNIRIQIGVKENFSEGVVRSGKFMLEIKEIFQQHGLPEELAYLPHVESSFVNAAHSHAGAKGIWQFTKGTGKSYLTINSLLDERLDPILAAEAAAKYLKRSYQQLGSWPLAITSYNYGRSGMMRAQKAYGNYPNIFKHYTGGNFKFASKNFYPEFLAALKTAKKLEKILNLEPEQKSLYFSTKGYISIASIASYYKLPERVLAALNPALKTNILQGRKYIPPGYKFRLPSTTFIKRKLYNKPNLAYQNNQKKDNVHVVKRGDTAARIANKYSISRKNLRKANNLNKKFSIRIGQKLILPLP
ncbi:MAG: transglycosylase SLT domain-containing protein [Desulfotalea sp.]